MKAYKLSKYGKENLKLVTMVEPPLKANQVLVKQYATSLNSADLDIIKGSLFGRVSGLFSPKYKVPGSDLAGVVVKVGRSVKTLSIGDRVFADLSEAGFGAFATHKVVSEDVLTRLPDDMSFLTAAGLASAGTIALQALEKQSIGEHSNICINGVGGGMGTICLQVAKYHHAHVVGVDSTYKRDTLLEYGVDDYIDFMKEDYTSKNKTYDLIIDCQSFHAPKKYVKLLKEHGVYTMIGGGVTSLLKTALFGKRVTKGTQKEVGILMGQMNNKVHMKKLIAYHQEFGLDVIGNQIYPFSDLNAAIDQFLKGEFVGKILIELEKE